MAAAWLTNRGCSYTDSRIPREQEELVMTVLCDCGGSPCFLSVLMIRGRSASHECTPECPCAYVVNFLMPKANINLWTIAVVIILVLKTDVCSSILTFTSTVIKTVFIIIVDSCSILIMNIQFSFYIFYSIISLVPIGHSQHKTLFVLHRT